MTDLSNISLPAPDLQAGKDWQESYTANRAKGDQLARTLFRKDESLYTAALVCVSYVRAWHSDEAKSAIDERCFGEPALACGHETYQRDAVKTTERIESVSLPGGVSIMDIRQSYFAIAYGMADYISRQKIIGPWKTEPELSFARQILKLDELAEDSYTTGVSRS